MADRFQYQFTQSLLPELVLLDGYVQVGPTGSITSATLPIWMQSLTRNSTGNYTCVLTDVWDSLTVINVTTVSDDVAAEYTICKVLTFQSGSVALTSPYATTPASFVFQVSSGGSAADPVNNGALMFDLKVHNTKAL